MTSVAVPLAISLLAFGSACALACPIQVNDELLAKHFYAIVGVLQATEVSCPPNGRPFRQGNAIHERLFHRCARRLVKHPDHARVHKAFEMDLVNVTLRTGKRIRYLRLDLWWSRIYRRGFRTVPGTKDPPTWPRDGNGRNLQKAVEAAMRAFGVGDFVDKIAETDWRKAVNFEVDDSNKRLGCRAIGEFIDDSHVVRFQVFVRVRTDQE